MPTKRILLLANSRKLSGRCLAGKEIVDGRSGNWIRPVSDREHQEVSEQEREYQDGSGPQILEIVDVPLLKPQPHTFQQENWLLDPQYYWGKAGNCHWSDLSAFADPVEDLWINGQSSYSGLNDRVALDQAEGLGSSLRLIHLESLQIEVFCPGAAFGNPKRRVQGQFSYNETTHHLWITDPIYERDYRARDNGSYALGECYLTISLGEPKDGFSYKLIAAIIEKEQPSTR